MQTDEGKECWRKSYYRRHNIPRIDYFEAINIKIKLYHFSPGVPFKILSNEH
mgnify:CR=1 FL=1